jgi:hypothetical protein
MSKSWMWLVLVTMLFFSSNSISAQRRTRGKRPQPPRPAQTTPPLQEETITVTGTSVNMKHAFAASDYKQAFYVGAAYGNSTPDSAVLSILSISKNYRYEKYSTVEILIEGQPLSYLSRERRGFRQASVDENGNAIEVLSVILSLEEFRRLSSARRVDITVWIDRFSLNAANIEALGKFVSKIDALAKVDVLAAQPQETDTQKCDLKVTEAPELRGFRLGQTIQDVLGRFPGVRLVEPIFGGFDWHLNLSFFPAYHTYPAAAIHNQSTGAVIDMRFVPGFEGVKNIKVRFTEGRISRYRIEYDDKTKWNGLQEFVSKTADSLGLASVWKNGNMLKCEGFQIEAGSGFEGMSIEIADVNSEKTFKRQQEEKQRRDEEEKKKIFKP